MKKLFKGIAILVILLSFTACNATTTKDTRFPASAGGYDFSAPPKSVISLSPALTDTLYALGYGGKIVATSDFCTLPSTVNPLPTCGTMFLPETEKITKLAPQMVFTSAALPNFVQKELDSKNIQVVIVPRAESLQGILENYKTICTAFEGKERASLKSQQLALWINTTTDYIAQNTKDTLEENGKNAIYLRALPTLIATGDSAESELLKRSGFSNSAESFSEWSLTNDEATALTISYIFCQENITVEEISENAIYSASSAVKNQRIFPVDMIDFERQSPKMFFQLEDVMKNAFPESFSQPKPSFILEMEPPAPVEKSWWEKLVSRFT